LRILFAKALHYLKMNFIRLTQRGGPSTRPYLALLSWLAILSLMFGVVPSHAAAQTPAPTPTYTTHTVGAGETLTFIADLFGVTVESLQQVNGITDPNLLSAGQELIIPHRVDLGETLAVIAKRYGTTTDELASLNKITNADRVYVGQSLVYPVDGVGIPSGATFEASPTDSLIGLSALHSQNSPWALAFINDLKSPFNLYAGEHIIVPGDPAVDPPLNGLPAPFETLSLRPNRPIQGGTIEIIARMAPGASLEGEFNQSLLRFASDASPSANRLITLQGINVFTEEGLYTLTLTATASNGSVVKFEQAVKVAPANFPTQAIYVTDPLKAPLTEPATRLAENSFVADIISTYTPTRQWNGAFVNPLPAGLINLDAPLTGFGWIRSYNGGEYDSYHDGMDFGAPEGTIISAAAGGTVVFAGPLQVRGNATVIDHGWGVYSGYWHQRDGGIHVQVGQQVQAGEAIGEVGSTGLSTGNHLHFAMWVGGNAVTPVQWLSSVFP
jgi:murein DD-endopeptidase MepM/ murein hydrolase activator NlpD